MNIYDFKVNDIDGNEVSMEQFKNQDSGTNQEIKTFCSMNYGVTFPMFEKIEVNGKDTHPLYKFLKSKKSGILGNKIKWNFTKFLVDKNGNVVSRFAPTTEPKDIEQHILELLK